MSSIITEKELNYLRKKFSMHMKFWQRSPVAFVYDNKIANILPYQAEIMQSVVDHKRTIVR